MVVVRFQLRAKYIADVEISCLLVFPLALPLNGRTGSISLNAKRKQQNKGGGGGAKKQRKLSGTKGIETSFAFDDASAIHAPAS